MPTQIRVRIDPNFHDYRFYMSPMTYKGNEILAYFAACKTCTFSSAWTTREARTAGFWRHRQEKVLEHRVAVITKELRTFNQAPTEDEVNDAVLDNADKLTDDYESWLDKVKTIMTSILGTEALQLPDYKYQVDYWLGFAAADCALRVVQQEYELTPNS